MKKPTKKSILKKGVKVLKQYIKIGDKLVDDTEANIIKPQKP